ncbi:MAG: glycine zipper domain-containing protein [Lentisphaeria bacterium]|jgi:hypothetical protein
MTPANSAIPCLLLAAGLILAAATGCAGLEEHKGAATGAVIGGTVGALTGSAVGGEGNRTGAAIIGGAVGAAAGGAVGHYGYDEKQKTDK